jgi:hypothetical protein
MNNSVILPTRALDAGDPSECVVATPYASRTKLLGATVKVVREGICGLRTEDICEAAELTKASSSTITK